MTVPFQSRKAIRGFLKPAESLATTLDSARGVGGKPMKRPNYTDEEEGAAAAATSATAEGTAGSLAGAEGGESSSQGKMGDAASTSKGGYR